MDSIHAACSWANIQVLSDNSLCTQLGEETVEAIRSSNQTDYLDALARALLLPGLTDRLFVLYEPLAPELLSRSYNWTATEDVRSSIDVLACSARILPAAPCLKTPLRDFLAKCKRGFIGCLAESSPLLLPSLDIDLLRSLLVSLFRMYSYDVDQFNDIVSPVQISSLLRHRDVSIRYYAVRCLALYMKLADAMSEKMISIHIPEAAASVEVDGAKFSARLFSLKEEQRWRDIFSRLESTRHSREWSPVAPMRPILLDAFSPQTANLAGILLPKTGGIGQPSCLVTTPTTSQNLARLAKALLQANGILLSGSMGSGKTLLVTEAAKLLNKSPSMATLHLNEQTDAKSLLGIYTTSPSNGSFVWQPGVLVRAMLEGRWVLIEDIHRAPSEIAGILLPIIEHGEILIPGRNEKIRAATGFCVIATTSEMVSRKAGISGRLRTRLNLRLWKIVDVEPLPWSELEDVLSTLFPLMRPYLSSFLTVHRRIQGVFGQNLEQQVSMSTRERLPTWRDLFKWCWRSQSRLQGVGCGDGTEPVDEKILDEMLQDGVGLYAGHLSRDGQHAAVAKCIAEAMQISSQRMRYCIYDEVTSLKETGRKIRIGRGVCTRIVNPVSGMNRDSTSIGSRFALTRGILRTMEEIAVSVQYSEPVLLIGETGVGKTAVIQHLARLVGQKLTVVNLSQQSESGDLLGGMKPITTRSLAVPMSERFDLLFEHTFSTQKNAQFLASTRRCLSKRNWTHLTSLWEEAVGMAKVALGAPKSSTVDFPQPQPNKRRKLQPAKDQALRHQWENFEKTLSNFKIQVSHGQQRFAFAFVEGKIVQALRNGEWVLLDEVNLATPETLQSITDLLYSHHENSPSLLLPDAETIDRIQGHENFRLFAAMNPATDTGKRELPLGIRTRFTEIFVQSPDASVEELSFLISTYLAGLLDSDKRAATDLASCYLDLQKLNREKHLTDGAGHAPNFSLRSLVRTLIYVDQNVPTHGLRRALYEGFLMSFATMLGVRSEITVRNLAERHLFGRIKNARSLLSQGPKPSQEEGLYIIFRQHFVRKGELVPESQPNYIITPYVERNLLNLARAVSVRRFPILLQGPTSSGKTSMVEYLAKISGNEFVRVNNHEHTDLQEYLGSYASGEDGRLQYVEGVLLQALRRGQWIVLDELNLAPSDVLEALNRLLDDNRELFVPETQEVVKPHPNFLLFATQNPAGLYGGRKHLSRAFRNRFLELHFDDIPEEELECILRERSQIAPSFCARIVSVHKRLSMLRQSSRLFEQRSGFATLRDLFRWASRPADDRSQLAINGYMLLAERVRDPAEKVTVKRIIEEVMGVEIAETDIYSPPAWNLPSERTSHLILTPAMRRLLVLVTKALQNNEPVLLVGDTGCGKTQVCQTVASISGHYLHMVNAHSGTETGDLIGAQRPMRNKAGAEHQLRQVLESFLAGRMNRSPSLATLDELIRDFKGVTQSLEKSDVVDNIKTSIAQTRSLFEWADGCLITAMKRGEPFLLDEISLAEDSVLERLNSVLEPSRSILLAEKGTNDSFVRASPGFQFLATMNPGGDYGKRELSSALRNRLTEIWVPPLSDQLDMLPILQARLNPHLSDFAGSLIDFAEWFRNTFHTIDKTSTSLRDLLSWADFILASHHLDTNVSIMHGAALIFIDSLGASPAALTSINPVDIQQARHSCFQRLAELLQKDLSSIYFETPSIARGLGCVQCGEFRIACGNHENTAPDLVFDAPTTRKNALRVLRGLQLPRPILLEGDPGVGKTALIEALAKLAQKQLTRINLSDQTDLMDLFGSDAPVDGESAGTFSWRDGPLLRALQRGDWVLLDEMNLATQSVLEGLNSCFDHREQIYVTELNRTFVRHPNFVLFATQNPHHQGGGRKGLPASFVNRFTIVYTEVLTKEDLLIICQRKYKGINKDVLENVISAVSDCRGLIQNNRLFQSTGGPWEINLRDIGRWLDLYTHYNGKVSPPHFFDIVISRRFRTAEQLKAIQDIYDSHLSETAKLDAYCILSTSSYQLGTASLPRDPSHQAVKAAFIDIPPRLQIYAESLIHCINQKWPAVLVGEPGSGKTSLIRMLASLRGARLLEFSVTEDIDTTDLVGGFEQYHQTRAVSNVVSSIRQACLAYLCESIVRSTPVPNLDILLEVYSLCNQASLDTNRLQVSTARLALGVPEFANRASELALLDVRQPDSQEAHFVWNDGVLVEAVDKGHWLVLDNANTCSSAVLDRLNALLEPGGRLIIGEQHDSHGNPRSLKPHNDFRIFLTMDPRRGELSRAMRNRSIEIHLTETATNLSVPRSITYPTEAAISNFRRLTLLPISRYEEPLQLALAALTVDHLSTHDLFSVSPHDLGPIIGQVHIGTIDEMTHCRNLPASLFKGIEEFQKSLTASQPVGIPPIECWPLHPECNQPAMLLTSDDETHLTASRLSWLLESFRDLYRLQKWLSTVELGIPKLSLSNMNILERSIAAKRWVHLGQDADQPFAETLKSLISGVREALTTLLTRLGHDDWPMDQVKAVLIYLHDMIDVAKRSRLPAGSLRVYLEAGHRVTSKFASVFPGPAESIQQSVGKFAAQEKLWSGQSLSRLWSVWRPMAANNNEQLNALLRLDRVTATIDSCPHKARLARVLVKIQGRLLETRAAILEGLTHVEPLLEDIERTTSYWTSHNSDYGASQTYFASAFESLCQYQDLAKCNNGDLRDSSYGEGYVYDSLLAGRSAKSLVFLTSPRPGFGRLARMASFGGGHNSHARVTVLKGDFALNLLQKITGCSSKPICDVSNLTEEVAWLSASISQATRHLGQNHVVTIGQEAYKLVVELVMCHQDLLKSHFRLLFLNSLGDPPGFTNKLMELANQDVFLEEVPGNHYFREIWKLYLLPAISMIGSKTNGGEYRRVGACLVSFALASLRLWIPNRPDDPVIELTVQRIRYHRQRNELKTKLEALKIFESTFSGRKSNLRIRREEQVLHSLGMEPPSPPVARPAEQNLLQVHAEFCSILDGVVSKHPEETLLSSMAGPFENERVTPSERFREIELLRQNLERLTLRLSQTPVEYADLTLPAMQFLQILDLGCSMLEWDERTTEPETLGTSISTVFKYTPLLGATPASFIESAAQDVCEVDTSTTALLYLDVISSVALIPLNDSFHSILQLRALATFESCYTIWKEHLQRDQAEETQKARYYGYRRSSMSDEENESQEMDELFPNFSDRQDFKRNECHTEDYDSRAFAVKMAGLHEDLFPGTKSEWAPKRSLTEILKSTASLLPSDAQKVVVSSVVILPTIFLLLEEKSHFFKGRENCPNSNIYKDCDIREVRNLLELIHRLEIRVECIHQKWPDHATPADILKYCKVVGQSSMSDSISQLLSKAERLHMLLNEWQKVASKEYSVILFTDELVALIIAWRRLELSSWPSLLDEEDLKVDKDAKAWWFVVYEAIIYTPSRLFSDGADRTNHAKELAQTLISFLRTTGLGQFSPRLRLLRSFQNMVQALVRSGASLRAVKSALSNVIEHFEKYEPSVLKSLADSKSKLVQEIEGQIKLASWKDSNITSLRDSARRSHYRLLKIVKKYRGMMGQAIQSFAAPDSFQSRRELCPVLVFKDSTDKVNLTTALQVVQQRIEQWQQAPRRVREPFRASAGMVHLYNSSQSSLDVGWELHEYVLSLTAAAAELRSKTPSNLDEDNRALLLHLKGRKHRLLAEVLSHARHMGIRRNLNAHELERQRSLESILGTVPDILDHGLSFTESSISQYVPNAQHHFHGFLDLIDEARERRGQHSEDLTSSEIGRCIGSLEGLLLVMQNQRCSMKQSLTGLASLHRVCKMINNLSTQDFVVLDLPTRQKQTQVKRAVASMVQILPAACDVLGVQIRCGSGKFATIAESLNVYRAKFQDAAAEMNTTFAQVFPQFGQSQEAYAKFKTWQDLISNLRRDLQTWIIDEPDAVYLMSQVLPWADWSSVSDHDLFPEDKNIVLLDAFKNSLFATIDRIFIRMQSYGETAKRLPDTTDDGGWLRRTDQGLFACVVSLHMDRSATDLEEVSSTISKLKSADVEAAVALFVVLNPLIQQFYNVCQHAIERFADFHGETCRMAHLFTKLFNRLASEGFCGPVDTKTAGEETSKHLDQGTGLGEGEGNEDISKEVDNDEDLSELAQQQLTEEGKAEIEKEGDAVDMGADDLQGKFDEFGEAEHEADGDQDTESGTSGEDFEEETGSVDDLDPSAVDEKLWDGLADEGQKDLENEKGAGKSTNEKSAAQPSHGDERTEELGERVDESEGDDFSEHDDSSHPQNEKADPQLQSEDVLELPDGMQLDGDQNAKEDSISIDGLDQLSDVAGDDKLEDREDGIEEVDRTEESADKGSGTDRASDVADSETHGTDDDVMRENQSVEEDNQGEDGEYQTRQDDDNEAAKNTDGTDTGTGGQDLDNSNQKRVGNMRSSARSSPAPNQEQENPADGSQGGILNEPSKGTGESADLAESRQAEAFKKLGDVLETWHRRQREILQASESKTENGDLAIVDADFEHVENDEDQGDAQALGMATKEQAQAVDEKKAVEDTSERDSGHAPPTAAESRDNAPLPELEQGQSEVMQDLQSHREAEWGSFIATGHQSPIGERHANGVDAVDQLEDVDNQLSSIDLATSDRVYLTSPHEASSLWSHYSAITHPLSLVLTEQLRLILSPTQATKLRGDFRTGKRLNLRRIIPYIASQYRRDKIWMRRSVPSKRNYQIMIAVDDSKSMAEGGTHALAFETLALLCKSLSMLEVGEFSVVGFGNEDQLRIAHGFGMPFTNSSGSELYQHFSFQQQGTNVRKLIQESIRLFREARAKSTNTSSSADLWQLQLIISDGICEEHELIRRLVRQASEERIMIVFVVVDSNGVKGNSILDLTQAVFEPEAGPSIADDGNGERGGEMKLKMKRYLDGFPFPYYVVVRKVADLPEVLATALKGWFSEVVDVG